MSGESSLPTDYYRPMANVRPYYNYVNHSSLYQCTGIASLRLERIPEETRHIHVTVM